MATPGRHGLDWGRAAPTPPSAVGQKIGAVSQQPVKQIQAPAPAVQVSGVVPTKVINAFYQMLPSPVVQQIVKTTEVLWNPATHVAGTSFALQTFTVPDQYVYIFTDIFFYGICPTALLEGPPVQLGSYQLAGLLRFTVEFSNRPPLRIESDLYSPYESSSSNNKARTGWPLLDTQFGARRGGGFAVYARSQQVVLLTAFIDATPRFSITKIGAHLHGFAVPEAQFDLLVK